MDHGNDHTGDTHSLLAASQMRGFKAYLLIYFTRYSKLNIFSFVSVFRIIL